MKFYDRNYGVALSKIKHHYENIWCGYVTPSEAVALMRNGAIAENHYESYMKGRMSKGDSKPSWFYFKIAGGLKQDLSLKFV